MFFKKNTCSRCGRKISKNYDFCPFCGKNLREYEEEDFNFSDMRMPFPFGALFNQLTKELARELDKMEEFDFDDRKRKVRRRGISISISNVGGVPKVKVGEMGGGDGRQLTKGYPKSKIVRRDITKEEAERYAKLPRKEAETSVRRFSDSIVYEISLPGVTNIKDIFVSKLKNSIEIKAFGKDSAYFKLIPLDLHIKGYGLKDEKLILELRE